MISNQNHSKFRSNYLIISLLFLACLFVTSSVFAQAGKHIRIEDWKNTKLCQRPAVCCVNASNCVLDSNSCTPWAANTLSSSYIPNYTNPDRQYAWIAAQPCSVLGSYRDIGVFADKACVNCSDPKPMYSRAEVIGNCSSLLVSGNIKDGLSQTTSSASLVYDFSALSGFSVVDPVGLAQPAVIDPSGLDVGAAGITLGSGFISIPVCHKTSGLKAGMTVKFHFADGSSYQADPSSYNRLFGESDPNSFLLQPCSSVDALPCPIYTTSVNIGGQTVYPNLVKISLPSASQNKKLGAITINFTNIGKLFIGRILAGCDSNSLTATGSATSGSVFSCANSKPACLGCQTVDNSGNQGILDIAANELRDLAFKANKEVSKAVKNAKLKKADAAKYNKLVKQSNIDAGVAYKKVWTMIYTNLPAQSLTCPENSCTSSSSVSAKAEIFSGTGSLVALIKNAEATIKKLGSAAKKNKAPKSKAVQASVKNVGNLVSSANEISIRSQQALNAIPNLSYKCN
jgi:hypothetical protein